MEVVRLAGARCWTLIPLFVGACKAVEGAGGTSGMGTDPSDTTGQNVTAATSSRPGESTSSASSASGGDSSGSTGATTTTTATTLGPSGSADSSTGPGFHGTPGCGLEPSGMLDGSIDVDGVERSYILEYPEDYDPAIAYPLIFGFHGSFDTGSGAQLGYNLFSHFAGQAIVVYPDGLMLSPDGPTGWRTTNGSADMNFVLELTEAIGLETCFDLRKVYTFGYSQGATMASALACYRGDVFSGVGAIAGVAPSGPLCQGAVAAFIGHGQSDTQVPHSQGEASRDLWHELAGCAETSTVVLPDGCVAYDGCTAEAPLTWCSYDARHMFDGIYAEAAVALFRGLEP